MLGVGGLLMAAPQMLASVIGSSPYARQIRYQYTSVMIAPLIIAAIEGTPVAVAVQGHARRPAGLAAAVAPT